MTAEPDVDNLASALKVSQLEAWDYGRGAAIVVIALLTTRILRFTVARAATRRGGNTMLADLLGRLGTYVILALGGIYALDTLGVAIGPVLGALGIAGIALAFALQDMVENFVAGITLQISRPFEPQDEVTIADRLGRVGRVDVRSVTLETPEGETVVLPTVDVIKNPITNHTRVGRRRTAISVGVAYGSDLDRAKSVIVEVVRPIPSVLDDPPPEAFLTGFGDSSIDFEVLVWHHSTVVDEMRTRNDVVLAIYKALNDAQITIPFPQRVVTVADADPVVDSDPVMDPKLP